MNLGQLSMDIPSDWEDRSMYTFIAPRQSAAMGPIAQDDGFRTNVVVRVGPRGQASSLAELTRRAAEEAKTMFGAVTVDETPGPTVGGVETRRLRYRIVEPGGTLPIAQYQYLLVLEKTERTITFTTAAVHAKALEVNFDEMVRSIRLSPGVGR